MATAPDQAATLIPAPVPARTPVGRWWYRRSLRTKLLSVVVVIALVGVPPVIVGLVLNARLTDARAETRAAAQKVDELNTLQDSLQTSVDAMLNYLALGLTDVRYVERYREEAAKVPGELEALYDDLPADLVAPVGAMEQEFNALLESLDSLTAFTAAATPAAGAGDGNGNGNGVSFSANNIQLYLSFVGGLQQSAATYDRVEVVENLFDQRLADGRRETDRLQRRLVWGTLLSIAAALAAAAAGILLVTGGLVRRIEQLSHSTELFFRREPMPPAVASTDEIGQLTGKLSVGGELLEARREEAIAATRAKDEFLARVSHELKTPLTAMIGFAQMLDEEPELSDESREDVGRIVSAGEHLHQLIEEMLDIKAIEAGKLALTIEPLPVREAVDDALTLIQTMANARSITITTDCPADAVAAADRRRLREVLLNLLSNAVKYNREAGHIDVIVTSWEDAVHVAISDTGPGITPEDREHLFTPFERLGPADSRVEGTGIGLMLAKRIVEVMGGTIGVDSTPGQGSTFWFSLPTPRAGIEPAPATEAGATEAGGAGGAAGTGGAAPRPVLGQTRIPPPRPTRTRVGAWWSGLRLRVKLLSVVAVVGVVSLPALVIGIVLGIRLHDARDETRTATEKVDELNALQASLVGSVTAIQGYVAVGLDEIGPAEDFRSVSAAIPAEVDAVQEDLPADLVSLETDLEPAVDALLQKLGALTDFGVAGTEPVNVSQDPAVFTLNPALVETMLASLQAAARAYDVVEGLENELNASLAKSREETDRLQGVLSRTTVATMLAAIVAAGAGIFLVAGSFVRRIERLSDNTERFVRNEPIHVSIASTDEIGQLTGQARYVGELLEARREEAVAATQAKDEFLSRVSHELKTPLTAMIGFAQLVEEDPALPDANREDVGRIISAGEHLHQLIEEMLDIKTIEAGKLALTIEQLPVRDAVDDALTLVHTMASHRAVSVTAECAPDAVVVADRRRLRETLLNLLSNAVKYNHEGGHVEVTAASHDGVVHVAVTDTGPGITPEDQQHLFKPFERLKAADTSIEGSGIGLSLTKHIVEAMGGTIGVDSTPGQGSTFWFDLPTARTSNATTGDSD